MQGWADDVDFRRKTVTVEENVVNPHQGKAMAEDRGEDQSSGEVTSEKKGLRKEGKRWEVPYDKLVVAVGCSSQTFGTKGVKEHAFFMKDVEDARRVRKRVLECFEIASLPTTNEKLRKCTFRGDFPQSSHIPLYRVASIVWRAISNPRSVLQSGFIALCLLQKL